MAFTSQSTRTNWRRRCLVAPSESWATSSPCWGHRKWLCLTNRQLGWIRGRRGSCGRQYWVRFNFCDHPQAIHWFHPNSKLPRHSWRHFNDALDGRSRRALFACWNNGEGRVALPRIDSTSKEPVRRRLQSRNQAQAGWQQSQRLNFREHAVRS